MTEQTFTEFLVESSLSRVYRQSQKHAIGAITAFRKEYSKHENRQRNKSLLAKLSRYRYGVTAVKGSYIENFDSPAAVEVGEEVYLVVDLSDRNDLRRNLKKLGSEFDQDSILFVEKGGKSGKLIGTNDSNWPGRDNVIKLNNPIFGEDGEFFTRVNGRPFVLKEETIFTETPSKGWGKNYAIKLLAETHWSNIEV